MQGIVKTSYNEDDAIILLKDLTNVMKEMSTEEREKAIQHGVHYSEMLPMEHKPSKEYEDLYYKALKAKKKVIAEDIAKLGDIIWNDQVNPSMYDEQVENLSYKPVLISLARAGIPVGILLKRYIKLRYGVDCKHYAISIIRDKGIDENALNYIYENEVATQGNTVENFFFIDGWTGKGAINTQLKEAVYKLNRDSAMYNGRLKDNLYVLADPANITIKCGTHEDFLLPSACLNSTVSGLISRTILNSHINVSRGDFHGAVYFKKFEEMDKSIEFIDTISAYFGDIVEKQKAQNKSNVINNEVVNRIVEYFGVNDYKKVKPGIGETTRVLLRRIPWKVLINTQTDMEDPDIRHILVLCKEKNVPIERFYLGNYKVCGIIKELADA